MLIRGSCPSCGHDLRVSVFNKTIQLDKRPEEENVTKRCIWCGLSFMIATPEQIIKHLDEHLETLKNEGGGEARPEFDPQDGCEHLVAKRIVCPPPDQGEGEETL